MALHVIGSHMVDRSFHSLTLAQARKTKTVTVAVLAVMSCFHSNDTSMHFIVMSDYCPLELQR